MLQFNLCPTSNITLLLEENIIPTDSLEHVQFNPKTIELSLVLADLHHQLAETVTKKLERNAISEFSSTPIGKPIDADPTAPFLVVVMELLIVERSVMMETGTLLSPPSNKDVIPAVVSSQDGPILMLQHPGLITIPASGPIKHLLGLCALLTDLELLNPLLILIPLGSLSLDTDLLLTSCLEIGHLAPSRLFTLVVVSHLLLPILWKVRTS